MPSSRTRLNNKRSRAADTRHKHSSQLISVPKKLLSALLRRRRKRQRAEKPESASSSTSIFASEAKPKGSPDINDRYLVCGLDPYQHLDENMCFSEWQGHMIRLFDSYGVLGVMRKAVDVRESGHWVTQKLQSGDLDPWDESHDMTLLLRADALIDESIEPIARHRVVGVQNVHMKWLLLKTWATARHDDTARRLTAQLERLRLKSKALSDVDEYIDRFAEYRAELVGTGYPFGSHGIDTRVLFVKGAADHFSDWANEFRARADRDWDDLLVMDDTSPDTKFQTVVWYAAMLRFAAEEEHERSKK